MYDAAGKHEALGREPELAALRAFVDRRDRGARAGARRARPGSARRRCGRRAWRRRAWPGAASCSARPSGAEAGLSFAALIDLCEPLGDAELAPLPAPQRRALDAALLRAGPGAAAAEPQAIALGLRNALRALAAEAPVLVAVDDVQWLDGPSSDALAFAARRLRDDPVAFLLARRPGRRPPLVRALDPRAVQRLEVGPLDAAAIRALLHARLGLVLPRPLLQRVTEATLGNPLFALELGRALEAGGLPQPGEPLPVPGAVEELLGTRVAALPEPVRRVLLALSLGGELRAGELEAVAGEEAVAEALQAGVVVADGERIRAAHPLLAAAARTRARRRERRALHRALAEAAPAEESSCPSPGAGHGRARPGLAATVSAAAARAGDRGARGEGIVLAREALRLTPPGDPERPERLLQLACHLETAGEREELRALLAPEVDALPAPGQRVRAWLLLAVSAGVDTYADHAGHLERALLECGPDRTMRAHGCSRRRRCSPRPRASSGCRRRRRGPRRRSTPRRPRRSPCPSRCARSDGRAASAGCRSTTSASASPRPRGRPPRSSTRPAPSRACGTSGAGSPPRRGRSSTATWRSRTSVASPSPTPGCG